MCPIIGVTASMGVPHPMPDDNWGKDPRWNVNCTYIEAIQAFNGSPLILPSIPKKKEILKYLSVIDGLLLTGGGDIGPLIYGDNPRKELGSVDPDRDEFEYEIIKLAMERDLPILGICRGAQILNVSAGGDLYQNIYSEVEGVIKHYQNAPRWAGTHNIEIESGSQLKDMIGEENVAVNSFHHQAIKEVAPGFNVSARAQDQIIEGIECQGLSFVIGVQWHPETMWKKHPIFKNLFKSLVMMSEE